MVRTKAQISKEDQSPKLTRSGKNAVNKKKNTSSSKSKTYDEDVQKTVADSKPQFFDHWLMKSEPDSRFEKGVDMKFSIDDLVKEANSTACWDGVRNYEARNLLRDQMKKNQKAFFYHSNCKQPGIVGIVKIIKEGYPDYTQFDRTDAHFDASSNLDAPKWYMVDVKFVRKTKRLIGLQELKKLHLDHAKSSPKGVLHNLSLFTRSRLSVQPLTKEQFEFILKLEDQDKENN